MTMDGCGPYQIAKRLKEDQVEIPAVHMARHGLEIMAGKGRSKIHMHGVLLQLQGS